LRSILKVSQFASDLIQVAVNFNVRLSQFKINKKKLIYDGIRFPGLFPKKPDLTEPVSGPVRLILSKILKFSSVGFLSLNRTEPNCEHPYTPWMEQKVESWSEQAVPF
jgi:hypothetical protein